MKLHHSPDLAEAIGQGKPALRHVLLPGALHVAFIIVSETIPNPEERIFRLFEKDRIVMEIGAPRPASVSGRGGAWGHPSEYWQSRIGGRGAEFVASEDFGPRPLLASHLAQHQAVARPLRRIDPAVADFDGLLDQVIEVLERIFEPFDLGQRAGGVDSNWNRCCTTRSSASCAIL